MAVARDEVFPEDRICAKAIIPKMIASTDGTKIMHVGIPKTPITSDVVAKPLLAVRSV